MGVCDRVMSLFTSKWYRVKNKEPDYPFEDEYIVENPMIRLPRGYAIKEKRPYMYKEGFYNIYVVESGHVEEASDDDNE